MATYTNYYLFFVHVYILKKTTFSEDRTDIPPIVQVLCEYRAGYRFTHQPITYSRGFVFVSVKMYFDILYYGTRFSFTKSVCIYFPWVPICTYRQMHFPFFFSMVLFFRPCTHAVTHLYIGVSTKRTPVIVTDPDFLFRAFLPVQRNI